VKIVVLGASGGIGRKLVEVSAAAGHEVTAVGREQSDLSGFSPDIGVERVDVTHVEALTSLLRGQDVCLSGLGLRLPGLAPWASAEDPTFLRRAGPAIAEACSRAGVRRLVAVTAGGVGPSYDMMPGFFRLFIKMSSMRKVYPELDRFEAALSQASSEVAFARPTGLTDGPATGEIVEATKLVGNAQISRADVAAWMVRSATGARAPHSAVITTTGAG